MKKRAFLSVSDKTGIVDFARELDALGYEVVSTGGTEKALRQAGVPVTNVSDITGFPECLDGRVKTLHPMVHAGILAMRGNAEHMKQIAELGVVPIDIVCVNLYPFKQTMLKPDVSFEACIENIDIGGPSMLRAAAKNHQDVAVVVDTADYAVVLDELKANGAVSLATKRMLCYKVFAHTAAYDTLIASYLRKQVDAPLFPEELSLTFEKVQEMRYGENPHQPAVFYKEVGVSEATLPCAEQLNGKALSYNNINDTNGALELLREFRGNTEEIAVVGVKHANPCGVALAKTTAEAYSMAHDADPVSIFGGIVVTNGEIDAQTATEMAKTFLEIIVAPSYTDEALEILKKKKNLRILRLPNIRAEIAADTLDMKKVMGGLLVQTLDQSLTNEWTVVTDRVPSEKEKADLMLAWQIVKHTKSNAIALAKDNVSVGIGPGQVNRIWAVEQSIEHAGERAKGAALASDAFFPFDDCVRAAGKAGITCIIQPGGSVRDQESIDAANELGIAMVFTGMRHFKH